MRCKIIVEFYKNNHKSYYNHLSRDYYHRNIEKVRAKGRAYQQSEIGQRVRREWRAKNREYIAEYMSNFNYSKEYLATRQQRSITRIRGIAGQWKQLNKNDRYQIICIYAERDRLNEEAGHIAYHVDHIKPLAKGGKHHPDNLQILTAFDNLSKGAKHEESDS